MAAGPPTPQEESERSLLLARSQEMKLLEDEKRRLEDMRNASRLRYAAAVPLPADLGSPVRSGAHTFFLCLVSTALRSLSVRLTPVIQWRPPIDYTKAGSKT